jgi:hypothetical protein
LDEEAEMRVSHEHRELRLFRPEEIAGLRMPDGYKHSIEIYAENARKRSSGKDNRG